MINGKTHRYEVIDPSDAREGRDTLGPAQTTKTSTYYLGFQSLATDKAAQLDALKKPVTTRRAQEAQKPKFQQISPNFKKKTGNQ